MARRGQDPFIVEMVQVRTAWSPHRVMLLPLIFTGQLAVPAAEVMAQAPEKTFGQSYFWRTSSKRVSPLRLRRRRRSKAIWKEKTFRARARSSLMGPSVQSCERSDEVWKLRESQSSCTSQRNCVRKQSQTNSLSMTPPDPSGLCANWKVRAVSICQYWAQSSNCHDPTRSQAVTVASRRNRVRLAKEDCRIDYISASELNTISVDQCATYQFMPLLPTST